ncbi:hypothetical protein SSS_03030, partial [Sarcoptes scabiei]
TVYLKYSPCYKDISISSKKCSTVIERFQDISREMTETIPTIQDSANNDDDDDDNANDFDNNNNNNNNNNHHQQQHRDENRYQKNQQHRKKFDENSIIIDFDRKRIDRERIDPNETKLLRFCCAYQASVDCQLLNVQRYCGDEGLGFFQHYMSEMTSSLINEHCAGYTYSDICARLHLFYFKNDSEDDNGVGRESKFSLPSPSSSSSQAKLDHQQIRYIHHRNRSINNNQAQTIDDNDRNEMILRKNFVPNTKTIKQNRKLNHRNDWINRNNNRNNNNNNNNNNRRKNFELLFEGNRIERNPDGSIRSIENLTSNRSGINKADWFMEIILSIIILTIIIEVITMDHNVDCYGLSIQLIQIESGT